MNASFSIVRNFAPACARLGFESGSKFDDVPFGKKLFSKIYKSSARDQVWAKCIFNKIVLYFELLVEVSLDVTTNALQIYKSLKIIVCEGNTIGRANLGQFEILQREMLWSFAF